jgi:2-dehydropantoate 2-reductase
VRLLKTVVLGAGALGSILAAHLARAGQDVTLIARGPRARYLAENGVTVRGLSDFNAEVPIVETPPQLDPCDVFVMTAKTYDTQAALAGVSGLKADFAISVQNGVVKNDHLAATFGWEHTGGCIANYSGEVEEDGAVLFTRNEGLYFGELPEGTSERTAALAQMLNDAGIKAVAAEDIRSVEWSKYTAWMGLTAVAVLSRLYTPQMFRDEGLDVLLTELTREAVSLAKAAGVEVTDMGQLLLSRTLSDSSIEDCIVALKATGEAFESRGASTHRMSALQDLLRGRRLEVEETFGYAVEKAAELGVAAPRLETCYQLLSAIDRSNATA